MKSYMRNKPHVAHNSGEQEWYTPEVYLDAARAVLGAIDLDPASSDIAQQRVKAATYYTKENSGLDKHWKGRVFLNPPYAAGLIDQFIEKIVHHFRAGDVPAAIVLVNNATETRWYNKLASVASSICFHAGRIKFLNSDNEPVNTPLQGQSFLYLGEDSAFRQKFRQFGFIVTMEVNE